MKMTLSILAFLLAQAAVAQVTTYNYSDSDGGVVMFGPVPIGFEGISGTIVLPNPLPASGTSIVIPESYSFTTPIGLLSSSRADAKGVFVFTTANGVVTGWNIVVTAADMGPVQLPSAAVEYLALSENGDIYSGSTTYTPDTCLAIIANDPTLTGCFALIYQTQGAWLNPPATLPADPPPVDPLAAKVAALTAANAALVTEVHTIAAELAEAKIANADLATEAHQLAAENAALEAELKK
jgi:hypothetical protein